MSWFFPILKPITALDLEFFILKLKYDCILVGAIPNEGGFAWGTGRFLSTRRFVHKNSKINYDKIICWEHVNFCDQILKKVDQASLNNDTRCLSIKSILSSETMSCSFSGFPFTEE